MLSITKVDDSTRKGQWSFVVKESASNSDLHGATVELLLAKHGLPSFDMPNVISLKLLQKEGNF